MIFFLIILDDLRCFPLFLDFFLESIGTIWYYHFPLRFSDNFSPPGDLDFVSGQAEGGRKGPAGLEEPGPRVGALGGWVGLVGGYESCWWICVQSPKPFASNLHQHIFLKVYVYIRHLMSRSAVGPSDPAGFFEFNLIWIPRRSMDKPCAKLCWNGGSLLGGSPQFWLDSPYPIEMGLYPTDWPRCNRGKNAHTTVPRSGL